MKLFDRFYLLYMRLKRIPFPYRNAEYYRRKYGYQIGANTNIFKSATLSVSKGDSITIGSNCTLTGCVILAHDASLRNVFKGPSRLKPVVIGNNCFIGYQSVVLMGVTIGDDVIVGAGAIVTKDIPSRSVVAGNPARIICTIDDLNAKYREEA